MIDEAKFLKIVKIVCDCLGYGANDNADELLPETAKAETRLGLVKDKTILNVGVGLMQFDEIGFEDTKQRCLKYKDRILDRLKIDISKVKLNHLAYNPLLSVLFTRLKYRLIPQEIPTDVEGRAKYWKRYYNTSAGAGTILHYLQNVDNC